MFKTLPFLMGLLVAQTMVIAQNYHAVNGSSYAGSLGIGNNPASIVNTPFAWDVTIFGVQGKPATNAVGVYNYSLLSSPANSAWKVEGGYFGRFAQANANVNLLNTRIALKRRAAIAFGANFRSYTNLNTNPYAFQDTLKTAQAFLMMNGGNTKFKADLISSSWLEFFASYGQTILDDDHRRLNAGVTMRLSRGLSGAHTKLATGQVEMLVENGKNVFVLRDATARYGYSANFDGWKDEKSTGQNIRDFANTTEGGVSFDVGVEYLIKEYLPYDFNDDEERYYDYDWKIGISLMDIGFNQYKHSLNSRTISGLKGELRDVDLDEKFKNIEGIKGFNDSLQTIVSSMARLSGNFMVLNPTRLVVNVDRYLFDAFYVNADISINLSPLAGDKRLYVKETNLLAVTPRWETRSLGVYLPMMYNTERQFRVGGAIKAGPLLLGIHNWGTLFAKNKMHNGGGYIAFIVRPGSNSRNKRDKMLDCPTN
ncbi:hypothetical protein [Paraflavitalea sp. CAU 1676]|uniref:hypothetical protein n=1 Tax=Paraflavitalea sp. CAU 1676 TaxID=3032598 RepID=UPI0023DCBB9D|nr:hypothetical protein [Paraflavitalea sp. CAU 1676]MDF2187478.1 hypothetical protein [Paraflavitalea sp. CAU 1676]